MIRLHLDFQVQEFKNTLAQKQQDIESKEDAKPKKEDADEDEFWSDFSDDDFEIDHSQEKDELDILYNLQNWINSNTDIDFLKAFKPFSVVDKSTKSYTYLITCSRFEEALSAAGYDYCQISAKHKTDLMCLTRVVSCTQQYSLLADPTSRQQEKTFFKKPEIGMINYKQFLEDIREKPYKWW
mmetsp:Transcript_20879/g.32234  ORF Transcript_20879/g.32234 Transcript_20879/m.32234 type:complete len:183 (-) Transcript_20879:473-1021(-)